MLCTRSFYFLYFSFIENVTKTLLRQSTLTENFLIEKLPGNTELKVTTEDKAVLSLIKVIHPRKFLLSCYPIRTDTRAHTCRYILIPTTMPCNLLFAITKDRSTVANYNHALKSRSNEWNEITFLASILVRVPSCRLSKSSSNLVCVRFKAVAISHTWDKVRSV